MLLVGHMECLLSNNHELTQRCSIWRLIPEQSMDKVVQIPGVANFRSNETFFVRCKDELACPLSSERSRNRTTFPINASL